MASPTTSALSRRAFVAGAAGVLGTTALAASARPASADQAATAASPSDTPAEPSTGVTMKPGIYVGEGRGFDWIEPVRVKIEVSEDALLSVEVIERELNREEPLIKIGRASCRERVSSPV